MTEYEARALPRLERIEELSPLCAWDKWEFQCSDAELRARRAWNQLMKEQGADEVACGL